MKQNLKLLSCLLLLILVGCISGNTSREESIVSTTTISSSTLLPTETLTSIPTEIKMSVSTATVIPTPMLSLTPLPTLSRHKTIYLLYEVVNICSLPCWWGITPGVSTWTETKQYIEHLNPCCSFGIEKITNPAIPITKSTYSEMYGWSVMLPDADTTASIYLEVQNNIVTAIRVTQDLFVLFFPIHEFLGEADKPDKILVYISDYDKNNNRYDATLYLVYEQKQVLASYVYWGNETANTVNLCLQHLSPQEMHLWSSGVEISTDLSTYKPLEEVSDLNPDTFYERFKNKNHQCFEMSKDAWK